MLLQCDFESWALGHSENAVVILPTDAGAGFRRTHDRGARFPVLYLLHGGGSDHTAWLRFTAIERYANEHKIAVVMPHCPDLCYTKAAVTFPEMPWEGDKLFDYERYIAKELPDWVSANFPVSSAPENSYIAGFSLGGYGAAHISLMYPESYAAAGLLSPYIFSPKLFDGELRRSLPPEKLREYFFPELVASIEEGKKKGLRFPMFYFIHGKREVEELDPLFAEMLRAAGAETSEDYGDYPYGHEWATWDIGVRHFLERIPRTDAFAAK